MAKLSEDDRVEKQLFLFLTASEREEQFAVEAPVRRRKPSVDCCKRERNDLHPLVRTARDPGWGSWNPHVRQLLEPEF